MISFVPAYKQNLIGNNQQAGQFSGTPQVVPDGQGGFVQLPDSVRPVQQTPDVVIMPNGNGGSQLWVNDSPYGDSVLPAGSGVQPYLNTYLGQRNTGQAPNGEQIFQYTIANASGASQVLRVGSMVGMIGNSARYGLSASAADVAGVTAAAGGVGIANVGPVQIFSQLTCHKPMYIKEVRISTSDATQLGQSLTMKELNTALQQGVTDGNNPYNAVNTFEMDDTRDDLVIFRLNGAILDAEKWFEYISLNGTTFILEIRAMYKHNVAQFVPFGN